MERKTITIIGTGLIGSSLAIRLHEKKIAQRIIGVDSNTVNAQRALELEWIDEVLSVDEAIKKSEVIILAVPVDSMITLLPDLLNKVTNQIVIDLGSTKLQLVQSVSKHPKRGRYVAAHPMWGTENSGPQSAVKGAFENKAVILCNTNDSNPDAVEWAKYMFSKIGMNILEMEAGAHDLHAAYVSHISHVTSFALANTVLEKEKEDNAIFALASSGFESTVRLAKSHAAMWVPIFLQNRTNVLDVLDEHILQLEKMKSIIKENDEEGLVNYINNANRIRRILK